MWTPKRILLLTAGAALFLAGYAVYGVFFGGIDGLPPLPEMYARPDSSGVLIPPSADSEVDKKLQQAFGNQCPQTKQPIKFQDPKKGMIVAAAEASFKEPDGRVKLTNVSVALFPTHPDSGFPEINTITANYAFLKFDVPIKDPTDMGKGKVEGGELRGNIVIINNHRTPERHDDLEVLVGAKKKEALGGTVDNEQLFYDERKGLIWTDGDVHLIDKQTQPHPTTIDGKGMELYLVKNQPQDKKQLAAPPQKGKSDLNSVDKIVLRSAVEMHLFPEANSGFMSTAPSAPAAKDNKKSAPDKAHVIIKTMGPFVYDVTNDVARFDSPPTQPADAAFYDPVHLTRKVLKTTADNKSEESEDQLVCDHLTLRFRRKAPAVGAKIEKSTTSDREIESAEATAREGNEVLLSIGSENMACTGCEKLIYQSPSGDRGARTILRGKSLVAAKDGHKIRATELELVSANQKGEGQSMIAQGPGQVDLFDRNPGKGYTTHAIWKGLLTSKKYKEGDRDFDLLTLTEDAGFIDDLQGQKLFGQTLKVKLETNDAPTKPAETQPKQDGSLASNRQLPRMVEAFERVTAVGPDMRITRCDHLIIRFKDLVKAASIVAEAGPPSAQQPTPGAGTATPSIPLPKENNKPLEKEKDKAKPKQPIDLEARDVVVDVLRTGEKNDLQELLAIGDVHVHQNGETPKDKGVDIKGDTLNLLHFVEGDILKVFGDRRAAELQLQDIYLTGPKVVINQKENTAVVEGTGAMRMPSSAAAFDGAKPAPSVKGPKDLPKEPRAPTMLTVHWQKDMLFTGRDADFNGGVVAYQDDSTLQCQQLQVAFDKFISLKEGQKSDQAAKVEKVIAYKEVFVLDLEKDKKTKQVIGQRLLNCTQMVVDNLDNRGNAYGPQGIVASLQWENGEELSPAGQPNQAKKAAKPPQLMLTRIHFNERMFTAQLNDGTTRQTTFRNSVQVIHVPANSLDAQVDTNKLPPGGLLMDCNVLTVIERTTETTKSKVMQAEQNVRCWTDEMHARADTVIFDQTQDTVIFKGTRDNPAIVSQLLGGPGGGRRETKAETILYNRKTNTVQQTGVGMIKG